MEFNLWFKHTRTNIQIKTNANDTKKEQKQQKHDNYNEPAFEHLCMNNRFSCIVVTLRACVAVNLQTDSFCQNEDSKNKIVYLNVNWVERDH